MAITNANLLFFTNESIRTVADKLAGLLPLPEQILDAAVGRGFPTLLGTTNTALLQSTAWTDADYEAIPLATVTDSDSGGRVLLTNHDVIGVLRALVALKNMKAANPSLGPLLGRVAVNPRA